MRSRLMSSTDSSKTIVTSLTGLSRSESRARVAKRRSAGVASQERENARASTENGGSLGSHLCLSPLLHLEAPPHLLDCLAIALAPGLGPTRARKLGGCGILRLAHH